LLFNAKLKTQPPVLKKEDEEKLDEIRKLNNLFREIYFIHITIKAARLTEDQKKVKKMHSKTLSQEIWDRVLNLLEKITVLPKVIATNLNVLKMFIEKIKNNTN
jgi:hypothetical protein